VHWSTKVPRELIYLEKICMDPKGDEL